MKGKFNLCMMIIMSALAYWLVPTSVFGSVQVDGIYYDLYTSSYTTSASVASNPNRYSGAIDIPPSFVYEGDTYSVTSISQEAFYYCEGLTSVTIPNSVTRIGYSAFSGCSGLTSITIPNSVTSISDGAFSSCTGLTSVAIPNSVTSIGRDAFYCTPWYDSQPEGMLYINNVAYEYKGEMPAGTSLAIRNGTVSISEDAFIGCTGLTSVSIPNSVTSIGWEAFYGCTGLTLVTIPNSVTRIGSDAFNGCTGLTSIIVNAENPPLLGWHVYWYEDSYEDSYSVSYESVFYNVDNANCILYVPIGCKSVYESESGWSEFQNIVEYSSSPGVLASGSCGENVTYTMYSDCSMVISGTGTISRISDYNYYKLVQNLIIEEGVNGIGDFAFRDCMGLASITIPNSVTSIGDNAFRDCTGLTSITIPNSVTSIGDGAFIGCTSLTSVTIPNNVTFIGNFAFDGCTGLTSVTIPNSVTTIGNSAFSGCTGLTSVTIPNSVIIINDHAFSGCTGLTSVTIPNSVIIIGGSAFNNTPWYDNQPDGLIYINNVAYKYKGKMPEGTSFAIRNGTVSISNYAFYYCTGLTSVTIPNSVTRIGWDAFYRCTGLTSVTIPNSVTSIGSSAFSYCTGLTSITVEGGTPPSIGSNAFYNVNKSNCTLYVPAGSKSAYEEAEYWSEFQNIVEYTPAPDVLSTGSFGDNITYTIYSDMTMVISGTCAMKNCVENGHIVPFNADYYQKIKRVIIEEGITSIGRYAFWNFTCLTSVTIPNSVVSFGDGAFVNCIGLTSVDISNSVTTIGAAAFKGCTGLTSMTIPNSVTSIGSSAFEGCSGLISVTIPNGLINIGSLAFKNCIGLTSVTIPESVTSIGESAFSGCTGLTFVDIPNSVTSIGNSAFSGCTGLTSVEIPNSVTSIDLLAFAYCTGLTSVEIPNSVTSIGGSAFAGCANLNSIVVSADNSTYDSRDNCNAIIETSSNKLVIGCKNTVIPNSVTSIGGSSFAGCTGLATVDIPDGVTSIGGSAFSGCTGLTSITVEGGTPPSIGSNAFYNVNKSNCTLYVPAGSKSAYESAERWSEFQNIVEYTPAPEVIATGSCGYNVTYTIYSDMTMVISGTGAMTDFTINYDDDAINRENNELWSQVKTVTIEEGVTSIGNYAFSYCTELTSVPIPNSVTSIGAFSFINCTNLSAITIPSSVAVIGDCAFSFSGLTHFTIEDGNDKLLFGSSAGTGIEFFEECPLEYVYMGRNIRTNNPEGSMEALIHMGDVTYPPFSGQSSLTTLVIGDNVTTLEDYSFNGAPLQSLVIGKNVQTLGMYALSSANIGETVTIPSNVTRVGDCCFSPYISQLVIEKGDNDLELYGGVYSMDLSFCGIGDDDETIVESVYVGRNLTYSTYARNRFVSAYIDAELTAIPQTVEYGDEGNDVVVLSYKPSPIEATNIYFENDGSLGRYYFHDCSSIEHIYNMNPSQIGDFAFTNCRSLKTVGFDVNEPTSIGEGVFAECRSLTSLVLPDEITSIGSSAFYNCGLVELHVGPTPAQIGEATFFYEPYYDDEEDEQAISRTLYVPLGCRSVYENAEYWNWFFNIIVEETGNLEILATGSCGDNVTYTIYSDMTMVISGTGEMWDYSYDTHINDDYYQSIKSVIIEEGVTSIGEAAFVNCTSLTSITIPSSVSYIAATTYGELPIDFDINTLGAFYGCSVLSSINVDAGNPIYDSRNNCNAIIATATNKLIVGCMNSVIENSITSIGESAFEKCYGLTTMNIPNSVTSLGKCAFRGCRDLNSVTIPNSISLINIFTFVECPNLTAIYLEQKTPPTLVDGGEFSDLVFDKDLVDFGTLYVPAGSKSAYENAVGWCKFEHIVEYGEEPDTDISTLDNAIYVDHVEGRIGGTMDIPIKVKNSAPIEDFKFKMILPAGTTVNSWALSSNRLPSGATVNNHTSEQNIEGNTITLACMLNYNESEFTGNDGEIATVNVTFGENMEVGTYPIRLTECNIGHIDLSDVKATLNLEDYVVGDANGDGRVRIGDASAILHYIVGNPSADFQAKAADVNGDGLVRIGDVSAVLKIIVGL